jgi:2-haloacid dehalogenase
MLHLFDDIVSVDEIRTFKPDPAVYHHLVARGGASIENTWVVSSNPWDVIGAKSAGIRAVWVKRRKQGVYDPWGIAPDIVTRSLPDAVRTLRWTYPLSADAMPQEPPE